jgi:hypothetical protein
MKVFIAGIYCPYEGGAYATGIFSTREKAEQSAPWITDNAEYFRENHHKVFIVDEIEIDDNQSFARELESSISYMQYLVNEENQNEDNQFLTEIDSETPEVLNKLLTQYKRD